jgi:hypothetical protein
MFTDGTIWNWTFDPFRSKAACLSRINGLRQVFPREANQRTIADEFCPKPVIRNAREFDTRRCSLTAPCRKATFADVPPRVQTQIGKRQMREKAAEADTADFELSSRQAIRSLFTIQ